jgi:hypothetical protein
MRYPEEHDPFQRNTMNWHKQSKSSRHNYVRTDYYSEKVGMSQLMPKELCHTVGLDARIRFTERALWSNDSGVHKMNAL